MNEYIKIDDAVTELVIRWMGKGVPTSFKVETKLVQEMKKYTWHCTYGRLYCWYGGKQLLYEKFIKKFI